MYDILTHKAFSDWLDENDEPDLAEYHRKWSKEDYDVSVTYLENYARMCQSSLSDLLAIARETIKTKSTFRIDSLRLDDPKEEIQIFWNHYYTYTGVRVTLDIPPVEGYMDCCHYNNTRDYGSDEDYTCSC